MLIDQRQADQCPRPALSAPPDSSVQLSSLLLSLLTVCTEAAVPEFSLFNQGVQQGLPGSPSLHAAWTGYQDASWASHRPPLVTAHGQGSLSFLA